VPDTRLADRQHRCQRPPARRHRPPSGRTGLRSHPPPGLSPVPEL